MTDLATRSALKATFQTGDPLDQTAFENLIDSVPINSEVANPWNGVVWAALGTSITSQALWTGPLGTLIGTTGTNLGVSGASLSSSSSNGPSGIYNQITNIPSTAELVLLEIGINDFRGNATLGTITSTNSNTFYGAIYNAVVAILTASPRAKVVLITPYGNNDSDPRWNVANSNSNTWQQFCDAVRESGKRLGVAVCDIATLSGIGGLTSSIYMSDGIHINATGGTLYANTVYEFLRTIKRGVAQVSSGWTLSDAVIADIGGFRATPTAITAGVLTYTKSADYGVLWFGSTSQNAMQFDCSSNPTSHLAIGYGSSGAIAFGSYTGATLAFRIDSTGNIATSAIVASSGPLGNSATRFRLAVLNGVVRFEFWNGSVWTLDTQLSISAQSAYTSGYKENVRVGVVVNASSSVAFSNIKVGTYA